MEISIQTDILQVTNIAPDATLEQMKALFGHMGKITEIKLYPSENYFLHSASKVCYVRYAESISVSIAQHLTNTVFVDRALIVVPFVQDSIPDEMTAMALCFAPTGLSSSSNALLNQVTNIGDTQVIITVDPRLTALGLPEYPPLPATTDPVKIEEIRRTIYISNLDLSVSAEQLLKFFNQVGEVKYVRMAGCDNSEETKCAFVEFTDQATIPNVLQYNGAMLANRPLVVIHSTTAIIKPQAKSSEAAQKEIQEALKHVRDAQSLISSSADSEKRRRHDHSGSSSRSRSRHRSRSRRHSRSRSYSRKKSSRCSRSRHRSRSKKRSRSRRRSQSKKRSRSRHRSKGHHSSRSKRRSRSKDKSRSIERRSSISSKASRKQDSRSSSREWHRKRSRHSKSRSRSVSVKSGKSSKMNKYSDKENSPRTESGIVTSSSSTVSRTEQSSRPNPEAPLSINDVSSSGIKVSSVEENLALSEGHSNRKSKSRSQSDERSVSDTSQYHSHSKDKTRSKSKERYSTKSKGRHRSHSQESLRSKSKGRSTPKSKRHRDKLRSRSRERHSRSRQRYRSRSREKKYRKKSRSPRRSHTSDKRYSRSPKRHSFRCDSQTPLKQRSRSPRRKLSKSPITQHAKIHRERSFSPVYKKGRSSSPVQLPSSPRKYKSPTQSRSNSPNKTSCIVATKLRLSSHSPSPNPLHQNMTQRSRSTSSTRMDIVARSSSESPVSISRKMTGSNSSQPGYFNWSENNIALNKQVLYGANRLTDFIPSTSVNFTSVQNVPIGFHHENSNGSDHNVGDMDLDSS